MLMGEMKIYTSNTVDCYSLNHNLGTASSGLPTRGTPLILFLVVTSPKTLPVSASKDGQSPISCIFTHYLLPFLS